MIDRWTAVTWAPIVPTWTVAVGASVLVIAAVVGAWRSPGRGSWAALPLRLVIIAALVGLALRPTISGVEERATWSDTDVYFVVDTTASMGAVDGLDGDETRLESAQRDALGLLDSWGAQGSRAALVAFQREPRGVVPITTDTTAVARGLAALEPEVVSGSQGSAVGLAGPLLEQMIAAQAELHPERSALIVYLGDGENTATTVGDLPAAGELAQGALVLGYGTTDGARMIATTPGESPVTTFVVDPATGTPALSAMDPLSLEAIGEQLAGSVTLRTSDALPALEPPVLREHTIDGASLPAGTEDLAWRLGWVLFAALVADLAITAVALGRAGLPRRRQ